MPPLIVCPECAHEFEATAAGADTDSAEPQVIGDSGNHHLGLVLVRFLKRPVWVGLGFQGVAKQAKEAFAVRLFDDRRVSF